MILIWRFECVGCWWDKGVLVVMVDVEDVDLLRVVFWCGWCVFFFNLFVDIVGDIDVVECWMIVNIFVVLEDLGLEKVVVVLIYGVCFGQGIGDLMMLWELEEGLCCQLILVVINCGVYYMINWVGLFEIVMQMGKLLSVFFVDMLMLMVVLVDLGEVVVVWFLILVEDVGVCYVEGLQCYILQDVV